MSNKHAIQRWNIHTSANEGTLEGQWPLGQREVAGRVRVSLLREEQGR